MSRGIYWRHERRTARHLGRGVQGVRGSDEARILGLLAGGEICVCNIHECLGIPQPTASRHLAYLRRKNLVVTRKDGLWVHYKLAELDEPVMRVLMSAVTHVLSHCDCRRKRSSAPRSADRMLCSDRIGAS